MGIGNFLKREAKEVTSGFDANAGLQDWAHAAKIFADEDMIRSPKLKGLFHVTFVFNNDALRSVPEAAAFAETIGSGRNRDILSVLTKSIDLPKFELTNGTYNQYNKTTHTYKKIKFNAVSATFHDDVSDIIWAFWAFYYNWYFADGTKSYIKSGYDTGSSSVNQMTSPFTRLLKTAVRAIQDNFDPTTLDATDNIQEPKPGAEWEMALKYPLLFNSFASLSEVSDAVERPAWSDAWGLNGSVYHSASIDRSFHLLKAIEIYPLGIKQASVIVLHNPKIIAWDHDTFDYSAQGTATCKMDIVYEGVSYMDQISASSILNDVRFYDKHASPLVQGSPNNQLAPGGILDRADGTIGNVLKKKTGLGDVIKSVGISKTIANKTLKTSSTTSLKKEIAKATENAASALNNKVFPGGLII